jgi:hypothetical protein
MMPIAVTVQLLHSPCELSMLKVGFLKCLLKSSSGASDGSGVNPAPRYKTAVESSRLSTVNPEGHRSDLFLFFSFFRGSLVPSHLV